MKLAKFSNFIGVFAGVVFLVMAIGFSADEPMAFINLPGLLIVFGGTMTAMLVSFPLKEVLAALKQGRVVTEPLNRDFTRETKQILHFATLWFRNQYAMIDRDLERLGNPFLKKGLQMVRDKQSNEDIMSLLNWSISQIRAKESAVINIYRSMATFAPAFGMVGSLVGLVNMLQTIETGNLSAVSSDMGVALVTTFYGLLLANLMFKPIATKLEQRRHLKLIQLTMMAEGVALIQQQRTPSAIRDVLVSFMAEQDNAPSKKSNSPLMTKFSV
tara:strand:+ start:51140 stop:51955 length:816 start_codon:yes stop_codon:yes gene_type:complete